MCERSEHEREQYMQWLRKIFKDEWALDIIALYTCEMFRPHPFCFNDATDKN